jgi:hypothetical protein
VGKAVISKVAGESPRVVRGVAVTAVAGVGVADGTEVADAAGVGSVDGGARFAWQLISNQTNNKDTNMDQL